VGLVYFSESFPHGKQLSSIRLWHCEAFSRT
jgi:hypothetical protein